MLKQPDLANFLGKRVTIFGANRSGIAIATLLHEQGAHITLTDSRDADSLSDEIAQLDDVPIQFYLGCHENACIADAELIVVSPGVPLDLPILVAAKKRDIPILGELEVSASLCNAPIIAITGTKGKSTTTLLTAAIFKEHDKISNVVVAGNIGVPLASKVSNLTSADVAVVEASSFQLETTVTFKPDVSVVLNLSRDHLDRHKTMAAYFEAKKKICQNQKKTDWLVLNANDEKVRSIADCTHAKIAYFTDFPLAANSEIKTFCKTLGSETFVCLKSDSENNMGIYTFKNNRENWICNIADVPLAGAHNIRNLLAAVVVANIFGVKPKTMQSAIRGFKRTHPALEHAYEKVRVINGVDYINDSKATNVISACAALESIESPTNSKCHARRVFLIIGGYDKGNDYTPLIELVRSKVKCLVLLGEHTKNIEMAFTGCADMYHASTMNEAIKYSHERSIQGDVVLLSPANASFDMFKDYKERGEVFKKIVNAL